MAANAKEEKKGGKRQTAKKTAAKKKTGGGKKVSRGKKTTGGFRWWKLLFFAAFAVGAALALYVGYCFATLPDIEQAVSRTRQPSTSIIAENGQEIATFGNVYSEVVYPDELPPYVINAVIAISIASSIRLPILINSLLSCSNCLSNRFRIIQTSL